jgi:competence protein ComEC
MTKPSAPAKICLVIRWSVVPLLLAVVIIWITIFTFPDKQLHVSFLDVGQGDAILIQTPCGQNILIDGGPSPQSLCMELGKELPFWDRTIDLMISTQPHADHLTGLVEVLQRYQVRQVLQPTTEYNSSIYQKWTATLEEKQIKYSVPVAGQEIKLAGDIVIKVFNPPVQLFEQTSSDTDNNGIVVKLSWGQISFLFSADVRYEAELNMIMQRYNISSTVLKVAHHGSKTSTSPQFLLLTDPDVAVISVGAENSFGHPDTIVLERLCDSIDKANIYRTDLNGTIEFTTDGERLWVQVEKY